MTTKYRIEETDAAPDKQQWSVYKVGFLDPISTHESEAEAKAAIKRYEKRDRRLERDAS